MGKKKGKKGKKKGGEIIPSFTVTSVNDGTPSTFSPAPSTEGWTARPFSRTDRIVHTLLWAADIKAIPVDSPNGVITWPCPDGWVPAWLLAQPHIGGASCDRRLRELMLNNPKVERRLVVNDLESVVEYRYAPRKNR